MIKFLGIALAGVLLATPAVASDFDRQVLFGAVLGAGIGAATGGPVGAAIGELLEAWLPFLSGPMAASFETDVAKYGRCPAKGQS